MHSTIRSTIIFGECTERRWTPDLACDISGLIRQMVLDTQASASR